MDPLLPRAGASPEGPRAAALRLAPAPTGAARAVDVPCGTGLLAVRLAEAGWRVRGLDLDPEPARRAGVDAVRADMEGPLPLEDGSAELVTCVEGIEHVEAQAAFVRECARVLAPGGRLVLTTPNVLGRPSRTSMARHGYARFFRPRPRGAPLPYEHEHRHPIDAVRLDHLLGEAGLVVEAWDGDRGPDGSPSLRERLARRLAAPRLRRHNARADLLLDPAIFHSRIVALRARKA